ncbi:hypothetical protein B0H10DRAFT_412291 [Mycena sp. CBHHK59/15]|nr:hypothetical protein B0H10DRAFT_412291 [Mycena sp. CBHHK59/15]
MPSSPSLKNRPLSYLDAVRIFTEIENDLKDTCKNLGQSTVQLFQAFDSIHTQLHSVDLQRTMHPVKPQWKLMHKEYTDLVWKIRTNASSISARIKMFGAVVLPLAVRPSTGQSSRSHREKFHVLQSYMTISAEQAALTFQLVEKVVNLNSALSNFHTEIAKAASQRASSGQRELQDLSYKILELQTNVKNLYSGSSKLSCPDVTYVVFTAFRLIKSSGQHTSRAKLSRYNLTLGGNDLSQMSNLYQGLDRTRSEVAHQQYTSRMSHRRAGTLSQVRTAISDLVPSELLTLEAALSFFMSIWLRLQADCLDIVSWIQNDRNNPEPPPCIAVHLHGGYTIYSTLANSLDLYVEAIDPLQFSNNA